MLYSYLVAMAGTSFLMALWGSVLLARQRNDPHSTGDEDLMAGHAGCLLCPGDGHCERASQEDDYEDGATRECGYGSGANRQGGGHGPPGRLRHGKTGLGDGR